MADDNTRYWFAAKKYGIGTSLPIAWQGWVLLVGYVAGLIAAVGLTVGAVRWGAIALATVVCLVIAARKTRGGWRWRWGRGAGEFRDE